MSDLVGLVIVIAWAYVVGSFITGGDVMGVKEIKQHIAVAYNHLDRAERLAADLGRLRGNAKEYQLQRTREMLVVAVGEANDALSYVNRLMKKLHKETKRG